MNKEEFCYSDKKLASFTRGFCGPSKSRMTSLNFKFTLQKCRNLTLQKLMYVHLNFARYQLTHGELDRYEAVKKIMQFLHCSRRTAYDYFTAYDFISHGAMTAILAHLDLKSDNNNKESK